jgi:hypothetical protein
MTAIDRFAGHAGRLLRLFDFNGSVLSKADGLREKPVSFPVGKMAVYPRAYLAETIQNAVNALSQR